MIEITFLGTSAMQPTKERNTASFLLNYKGETFLFDCGEGTQRQMKIAGLSVGDVDKIFITHLHGDHVLGLPGLIQTIASANPEKIIEIYGPKGTRKNMKKLFEIFAFREKHNLFIKDVKKGKILNTEKYFVETRPLEHGIPCAGYSFVEKDRRRINLNYIKKIGIPEGPLLGKLQDGKSIIFNAKKITPKESTYLVKGKKITHISDTLFCGNSLKLAKNSDVLICESSYADSLLDKAEEYKHMTARQAAMLATQSNSKELILTHFSKRYKTIEEIKEEAVEGFKNSVCAYDFMKKKIE